MCQEVFPLASWYWHNFLGSTQLAGTAVTTVVLVQGKDDHIHPMLLDITLQWMHVEKALCTACRECPMEKALCICVLVTFLGFMFQGPSPWPACRECPMFQGPSPWRCSTPCLDADSCCAPYKLGFQCESLFPMPVYLGRLASEGATRSCNCCEGILHHTGLLFIWDPYHAH